MMQPNDTVDRVAVKVTDVRARRFVEGMRVLILGGMPAGALLIGVGSRLAMLLLRVTSPDRVRGVTSDDGFVIGRVTLAGTYNLLQLGAGVGIIGAAAYMLVAPWLIGPLWFRRGTTGLASAAVVGSMLVHADGIDFTLLQPTWLAIGLFIALPGLFGTLIGPAVDAVRRVDSWTDRGRRRWLLPLVAAACFPAIVPVILVAAVVFGAWVLITDAAGLQQARRTPAYALTVRSLWLLVAVLGLVALIGDITAIV